MSRLAEFVRGLHEHLGADALARLSGSRHIAAQGPADAVAVVEFQQGVRLRSQVRLQTVQHQAADARPGRTVAGDPYTAAPPTCYEVTLDAAAIVKNRGNLARAGSLTQPPGQGTDLLDPGRRRDRRTDEHRVAFLATGPFAADCDFRLTRLQVERAGELPVRG